MVLDHREAALEPADRALCDYALKLTIVPGEMGAADLDALRAHGFSDAEISIATQVISYFNYINRIADGLGVDAEEWMSPAEDEWRARKGKDYAAELSEL